MNKNMLVMVIAIALSLSACGGLGDDFTGDIIVLSDPGATVFLNNNNVGTVGNSGELLLQNLETRSHTLRASLSGHNHITKTVQVIRDDTIVVELYFDTDSGCVIDNDCDSGYVCIEGECTKAHELDLRIEGYGGVIVSVGENPFVAQQLGEHYNVFYECDDDEGCAFIVPEGYVISLEGSPSSGWEFDTWSELGVYADYIQATIMESAVFTAVFKKRENGANDVSCTDDDGCDEGYACVQGECRQTHELDLIIEGYGGVIVSVGENPFVAQDEGEHHEILFECAEDCKNVIPEGYVLSLEAVSNAGWGFVEWQETGYSGTYNQFYVDEPTIVTAVFKEEDNGGENGKACDFDYDCEPGYLCIDKKCVSGQNLLRVRVTDWERSVVGAQVVLSGISGKSCTTNSRGRCDIPGLPAGSYGFSATKENFETATGTITMREDGTVVNAIDFYYIQLLPYHGWADIRATQGVNEEPTTATVSYGLRSGCHTTPKNPVCQMIAESEIGPLTFGGHHRHYKDHVYSTGHTLNRGETIEVHINFQCNSNNDCGAGFGVIDDTTYTCNNQKICVRHCEINPNLPEPQTGTCFGGYLCVEADGYNTRICVVMD